MAIITGIVAGSSFTESLHFTIPGGGSVITTGYKGSVTIPFNGVITGWTVLSVDPSNTAGAIVIYVQKASYANFPSTFTDIYASDPPTIAATNTKGQGSATGWTTAVSTGDIFRFNVHSCTSLLTALLVINMTRT